MKKKFPVLVFTTVCVFLFVQKASWAVSTVSKHTDFPQHGPSSLITDTNVELIQLKQRLQAAQQRLGEHHPIIVNLIEDIGMYQQSLAHYPEAREAYWQAMRVAEKNYPQQHPTFIVLLNRIARSFFLEKNYDQADAHYRQAFAQMSSALGMAHIEVANFLKQLGGIYYAEGLHEQAEPLLLRALSLYQQNHGAPEAKTLPVLEALKGLYTQTNQPLRAQKVSDSITAINTPHSLQ